MDIENQYYNSKGRIEALVANRVLMARPLYCPVYKSRSSGCFLSSFLIHVGLIEESPKEALKGFREVVSMESEKGEW